MKRIYLGIVSVIFLFQSCGMSEYTMNLDKRMREIELGMDKPAVIALLGNSYKVSSAIEVTESEKEETFQYANYSQGVYDLLFRNGKLVQWQYLLPPVKQEAEVTVINKSD